MYLGIYVPMLSTVNEPFIVIIIIIIIVPLFFFSFFFARRTKDKKCNV